MTDLLPLIGRVAGILLPVVLIALAGFIWAKNDLDFSSKFVGDIALHIGVPPLLFATLLDAAVPTEQLAISAFAAMLFIVSITAILAVYIKATGGPANPRMAGLVYGNWGNVAMPICFFAFGPTGLAIAAVFFSVSIFLQFTLGWRIAAGYWPWRTLLTLPILWALVAAITLKASNISPPDWVMDTARLAGGAAIPCMLLALGGGVARMHPSGLIEGTLYAALRMGLGLGVGLALTWLLPIPAEIKPIVLLISLMPLAVFNYVLAEKTGANGANVAGYVVASTGLALITLPIALAVLMPAS